MGWLNALTGWIDPLKDKIDPLDSYVQTSLLGNQDVQNKVLPTIGTTVLDYFYPGAGAALRASNDASEGNWTGAGINALAGMYGLSSGGGLLSGGADAASGASGGLSGTEALSSIGGTGANAAGSAGSGSASAFGPMAGANEFGYQGLSSVSSSPMNTQFMTGSAGELAGVGGSGQTLASTAADAMSIPAASKALTSSDMLNLANKGFKMYSNAQNEQRKQAQGGMPMISSPDIGGTGQRQFSQFGKMSPYQNMQGYNPRKYGYQFKRGLLEG